MATLTEVVYPNTAAFSGAGQLNEGPFFVPSVNWLLRLEVHGKVNFQGSVFGLASVEANSQLWAVQWVPHGSAAADIITTADGPNWLLRQQLGDAETRVTWDQTSTNGITCIGYGMKGSWAGQLAINAGIDLYLSVKTTIGLVVPNFNLLASMRFWWA